jgi:hypothetical protein
MVEMYEALQSYFAEGKKALDFLAPKFIAYKDNVLQSASEVTSSTKDTRVFAQDFNQLAEREGVLVPGVIAESCKWLLGNLTIHFF